MQSNVIRVVAAVVDTRQLTLYREDGERVYIQQGDSRLVRIIADITPILAAGPGSVAIVDLGDGAVPTAYSAYEESSNGLVRLFRVAKAKLAELFLATVPPVVIGEVPPAVPVNGLSAAVQEILANAMPVSSPSFHEGDVGEASSTSTIVAVVDNQVITGVEKLKGQINRAVSLGSTKGMDAFMKRLAGVISQRRHSVEDLLKFLEKGDLPIADDGSIIIYKVLRFKDGSKDTYVDCHTRKVTQRVGSYVHMDANLVDPSRRNECSNGLHVARRGYLGSFSGDVVVLAKVAPEDVIAVPDYDANKMRVCGYHILFELSDAAFRLLKRNAPFTDNDEAKLLLGRALAGDHVVRLESVHITEDHGGGVIVTPLHVPPPLIEKAVIPLVLSEALPDNPDSEPLAPAVDPKLVNRQVEEAKNVVETRRQKATRLYNAFGTAIDEFETKRFAQELLDLKKTSKVGWEVLGIHPDQGAELSSYLN